VDRRVHIRPATIADIPSIINLERQSATAGHWKEEQYRQAFQPESPARLVLVAEAEPPTASGLKSGDTFGILGFLVAHHLSPEWELENIVVDSVVLRTGVGKRLMNALLATARKTHSSAVFLEVRESSVGARTLYEKAGFKQAGRRYSYYTAPVEDAILYRRALD